MPYMINVDLEGLNIFGGHNNCQSELHENLGDHHDLTVHDFEAGCRPVDGGANRPTRYWDDNDGNGYNLEQLLERLDLLQNENENAFPRRCHNCGVQPHVPNWD